MEIDVVGYHLNDFEPCRDCGRPAGFNVVTTDRIIDSLIKISNVFKESNKGVNKPE
jgi:hypothetical protein